MKIAAIYRAERYSPNSEEKDRLMMDAVVTLLKNGGHDVACMHEDRCMIPHDAALCVTMSRSEEADRKILSAGVTSLNPARSAVRCSKLNVQYVMRTNNIPMPPAEGTCGYWVKRGDLQPQSRDDVVFADTQQDMEAAIRSFALRGIKDVVTEAHVEGDLVKFYAVEGTGFFRTYYPTDDGNFKFDNELKNGKAEHYRFDAGQLMDETMRLSRLLDTPVCGGDCIVRPDGSFAIIDFNDWPSFSRCRAEAASAVVELINKKYLR